MTLALAMTLPDGAIIMTDGRRTLLNDDPHKETVTTDQASKIHRINDTLAIATYGLEPLSRFTLEVLNLAHQPDWDPPHYLLTLDQLLPQGFVKLKPKLSELMNLSPDNLITGFVLAGHHSRSPYIANILYSGEERILISSTHQPQHALMLGGFSCDAQAILSRHCQANPIMEYGFKNPDKASTVELDALKEVMAATIREVSQYEASVGGTIQFTLLRHNQQPINGIIPETA